ncbi:MAG TPA: porin [Sphingomonadaceae bacterium]|jgi:hypothetical protein|nr:porin [Sphingomonadaceae bacterium]
MGASRGYGKRAIAALALSALAFGPVFAASTTSRRVAPAPRFSLSAPGSLGSFTPAAADPKLAASFSRSGIGGGSGFRFTPAASPGSRRAVTVAVRARATTKEEAERTASITPMAITPTAYNLGVSVGWKRFALTGDVAKVDTGILPGGREAADVALSYSGHKWSTRLKVAADRASGEQPRLIGNDEAYSVDLGGSYALTRNLEVTGGMRYRLQRDRLAQFSDDRRDAQAVYIGTAFRF